MTLGSGETSMFRRGHNADTVILTAPADRRQVTTRAAFTSVLWIDLPGGRTKSTERDLVNIYALEAVICSAGNDTICDGTGADRFMFRKMDGVTPPHH
ncbi:hypothetical protein [Rhodobacter sp. 24-YEA-8]|uniref:hypothetical protein n=1 Tax=Rhodobacter sp. 24-YEA-8 TaxID=1884310 RepID=UPI00115FE218|nr:hypothetical protein [Rhodobacter sp. 24-YEA-8]